MRPRLESVYFGGTEWDRMARVLEYTARLHNPGWTVNVRTADPPAMKGHARASNSHIANSQKMELWHDVVANAEDGERILLIDTDTFVTGPLDDIWEHEFEFAYTTKPSRFPFNSGVVFVRVTSRLREFVDHWRAENRRLLKDANNHQRWRAKYGGINQAALGSALESGAADGLNILQIPCQTWNCEDSSWASFDDQTRIVHVKSKLRRVVFNGHTYAGLHALRDMWRRLEAEAESMSEAA